MYKSRGGVWTDPEVIPVELGNNLHYLIEKISNLLAGSKTLFLIDDIGLKLYSSLMTSLPMRLSISVINCC